VLANGTLVTARNYYAFGETLQENVATNGNKRYRFTGKERDDETNNEYGACPFGNSEVGRWNTVDPLYEKYPGWSSYNYCKNNPISSVYPHPDEPESDTLQEPKMYISIKEAFLIQTESLKCKYPV
jgi:RHS repeat-associated protein